MQPSFEEFAIFFFRKQDKHINNKQRESHIKLYTLFSKHQIIW